MHRRTRGKHGSDQRHAQHEQRGAAEADRIRRADAEEDARQDPRERRRKIISLTPKGHELIATLREMMDREPRRAKTA